MTFGVYRAEDGTVAGLRITAPLGLINTTRLRKISLPKLRQLTRAEDPVLPDLPLGDLTGTWRRQSDAFFVPLVVRYLNLIRTGTHRPTEELAKEAGITRDRTANLLHKARERGLLTRVSQGRIGGELTPKGHTLYKEINQRNKE